MYICMYICTQICVKQVLPDALRCVQEVKQVQGSVQERCVYIYIYMCFCV